MPDSGVYFHFTKDYVLYSVAYWRKLRLWTTRSRYFIVPWWNIE